MAVPASNVQTEPALLPIELRESQRSTRALDQQLPRQHPMTSKSQVPVGRVGKALGGQYRGMYVTVDEDPSRTGWHVWLHRSDPRLGPTDGWDIWADEVEDVLEWLSPDQLDVEWID